MPFFTRAALFITGLSTVLAVPLFLQTSGSAPQLLLLLCFQLTGAASAFFAFASE